MRSIALLRRNFRCGFWCVPEYRNVNYNYFINNFKKQK